MDKQKGPPVGGPFSFYYSGKGFPFPSACIAHGFVATV